MAIRRAQAETEPDGDEVMTIAADAENGPGTDEVPDSVEAGETQDSPERHESSLNFERRVIPDAWNETAEALRALDALVEDVDYAEAIEALGDAIEAQGIRAQDVFASETMQRTLGENTQQVLLEYRQQFREVLTVVNSLSRELAEDVGEEAPEEEQVARAERILEVARYLGSPEDVPDAEVFDQDREIPMLEGLREDLYTDPVEFASQFSDYAEERAPLEDISSRLHSQRRQRVEKVNDLVREFAEYDVEDFVDRSVPIEAEEFAAEIVAEETPETAETAPKTKEQYKAEFLAENDFDTWDAQMEAEGGWVINTQGYTQEGAKQVVEEKGFFRKRTRQVRAPQVLFEQKEKVTIPAEFTDGDVVRTVEVPIMCATFAELRRRGEDMGLLPGESSRLEGYYQQPIYTMDTTANSVVKAQELLWRLEAGADPDENGLHRVPIKRAGKASYLPLTSVEYARWKQGLQKTVNAFEAQGLTYERVKRLHERLAEEHGEPLLDEPGVRDLESDSSRAWYAAHLQFAVLGEGLDKMEDLAGEADLSAEEDEALRHVVETLRFDYSEFLAAYGRRSEYVRVAYENLTRRGLDLSPENVENEILRVAAEYEAKKSLLRRLGSRVLGVLEEGEFDPGEVLDDLQALLEEYEDNLEAHVEVLEDNATFTTEHTRMAFTANLPGHGNVLIPAAVWEVRDLEDLNAADYPEAYAFYEKYRENPDQSVPDFMKAFRENTETWADMERKIREAEEEGASEGVDTIAPEEPVVEDSLVEFLEKDAQEINSLGELITQAATHLEQTPAPEEGATQEQLAEWWNDTQGETEFDDWLAQQS
ncbi:hypothetical protein GF360_01695 [candidate division WWE3 bacterium]|nr:hypothetical protein [candidate division WWE3 bacterium]